MKKFIFYFLAFILLSSKLPAEQFDSSTIAYSSNFNFKNPKFEKKNTLYYFTLDHLNLAYEKWDTLNSRSEIAVRKVYYDHLDPEVLITGNNSLNTKPSVSHTMAVWVSNINSNLDIFYSRYSGNTWTSPQALQMTPEYEISAELTEYVINNNSAYYIIYQSANDIYLKIFYQNSFLMDTNLTANITEGCSDPKIRIYDNELYLSYLKSVNSVQRIVISKAVINSNFRLENISTSEILQAKTVSGINFSSGFAAFSGDGFLNYNYDTLGNVNTIGLNLGNYSDENIFTSAYSGKNLNGIGSFMNIITDDNSSVYYFSVFGWLRKANDSAMIIANGSMNSSSANYSRRFYLGDSKVNSAIDVSDYFPNTGINSYRFRLVWERKINNRITLVQSWFDNHLSPVNPVSSYIYNFSLEQNFPNPFNPETVIRYSLPQECYVNIKVYNALGMEISNMISQNQDAGTHSINWNSQNYPSGIYYYQLTAGGIKLTRKMTILK